MAARHCKVKVYICSVNLGLPYWVDLFTYFVLELLCQVKVTSLVIVVVISLIRHCWQQLVALEVQV